MPSILTAAPQPPRLDREVGPGPALTAAPRDGDLERRQRAVQLRLVREGLHDATHAPRPANRET